ncbi:MAG: tyrosine-type recombinase/integrase [Syntrophomonadaceae bacterium]|nr:tyrosine-type recombinase/integrase [Syntrophomonadaceae bacterium]
MARLTKIIPALPARWEDALREFLIYKAAQRRAERTLQDYRTHVGHFFNLYPEAWEDYDRLKTSALEYIARAASLATDTYNLRLKNLRAFFVWCVSQGYLPANPLDGLKIKCSKGRFRPVDEESLAQLLRLPDRSTYAGLRDYTLLLLFLDTGIRPSEAFSLRKEDINLRSLEVHVREETAKTRTSRTLPISPETAKAIGRLIAALPQDWKPNRLFFTCEGKPMTLNAWRLRLEYYGGKLGCKVSPYDLRHAFATIFLRNGGDIHSLRRLLGHTGLDMAKRYIHLSQADLHGSHAQASPLNTLLAQKRYRKIRYGN